MVLESKELMNKLYDASLITLGVVGVSIISQKVARDILGVGRNLKGIMKLTAAVGVGSVAVKYLQDKEFIPKDPFKQ